MDVHKTPTEFSIPIIGNETLKGGRVPYTDSWEAWISDMCVIVSPVKGERPIDTARKALIDRINGEAASLELKAQSYRRLAEALLSQENPELPDWMAGRSHAKATKRQAAPAR